MRLQGLGTLPPRYPYTERPNILLIGSDGVNANHMSVYGYERDTTPFLRQLAADSLVAENAFTNFGHSSWSVVAILTGKSPAETHLADINILTGTNSYEHLPGILRSQGYSAVQLAVPEYVDAIKMNFQDGFDVVNGQASAQNPIFKLGGDLGLGNVSYFISILFERSSERLLHMAYLQEMANPFLEVTQAGEQVNLEDDQKVAEILHLLENADSPLFIHVHLMGTHGPTFFPSKQVFSSGEVQDQDWMPDFYDDSILDFDLYVRKIVEALAQSGTLDDTIIILYSDHGFDWSPYERIPLLIRFPNGEHAGKISNNVQNMDIAPTLLDYLGIPEPGWMTGVSLLDGEPPPDRIAFAENDIFALNIVQCDRWYIFDLVYRIWDTGLVSDHTSPCGTQVASKQDIPAEILDLLGETRLALQEIPSNQATYQTETISVSRRQVAVRLLQEKFGAGYTPPPARGLFEDVPASDLDAAWLEQVHQLGIMDSCALSPRSFFVQTRLSPAERLPFSS